MILPAPYLAGLALAHGFAHDDAARAVAVALATSGGDTDYRLALPYGTPVDRRGLYGIDVCAWPEIAGYLLDDPDVNTAAAFALWRAAGDSFSWTPYATAAATDRFAGVARAAVDAPATELTFDAAQAAQLDAERARIRGAGVVDYRPAEARRDTLLRSLRGE